MLLTIQSTHNSPSLFFPDLNFNFFKEFFLKWRISFPSFTKSFADWKQDTYLIIFRCHVNWSWAESNPARCYALCFLFFQKPQTCVFENLSLSKKPSTTPTECTCEAGFRLTYRHAFSRKQQSPLTSQIYCECKQRVGEKARVKSSKLCLAGNCVLNTLKMGCFSSPHSLWYIVGDQCSFIE